MIWDEGESGDECPHERENENDKPALLKNVSDIKTWVDFADVLHLSHNPIEKTTGILEWSPLFYAIVANNAHVTKYLLENGADSKEMTVVPEGHELYDIRNHSPIHLVMRSGHGDSGKKIFDLLMQHGADPFVCQRETGAPGEFFDPFACGCLNRNNEMLLHYMQTVYDKYKKIPYRFSNDGTHFRDSNATMAAMFQCSEEVIKELLWRGAPFSTKNDMGCGTLQSYCVLPKLWQVSADTYVLDLLKEGGKITPKQINAPLFDLGKDSKASMRMLLSVAYWGCLLRIPKIKDDPKAQGIFKMAGGTALHCAVYRDKPTVRK